MRYWWVNQNQTFRQETSGGYLWSPKRTADGRYNQFYENMRVAAPGDVVFSYCDTLIRSIGVVQGFCYEAPKPIEFGSAGRNWDEIGWRVDVRFTPLARQVRPLDHSSALAPVLPAKYSPLRSTGAGNQAVYLAEVPDAMAAVLAGLIGPELALIASHAMDVVTDDRSRSASEGEETKIWERHLEDQIRGDNRIDETTRVALVQSRRGQGLFRQRVAQIEQRCRVTKVEMPTHLRASHCKPWRDAANDERLDGENGLFLTPTVDHLFDRGFITFEGDGRLLISPVAHRESMVRMGIEVATPIFVGDFTSGQRHYLEYHRENVFLHRSRS